MKKSIVTILFLLTALSVFAQKNVGVTGFLDRESTQINVSVRPNQTAELIGMFALNSSEDQYSETTFGLALRRYIRSGKIEPFAGAHFKTILLNIDHGGDAADFVVGVNGGAQYAIMENLYVGFQMEFNMNISDDNSLRFNNPGKNTYNTSVSPLYITIYW